MKVWRRNPQRSAPIAPPKDKLDRACLTLVRSGEIKAFHVPGKPAGDDLIFVLNEDDVLDRFFGEHPEAVMIEAGALACIYQWFEEREARG